jgi:hypothetical protein
MTYRERLEARLERRRQWAESRDKKAAAGFQRAANIADHIPMGQPILVGHHSERHARRDQERIHAGMNAGVESQDMAYHHRSKASGLEIQLARSIFSDDEDATAKIEDRIKSLEAKREARKAVNKIVHSTPKDQWTPEKETFLVALGLSQGAAKGLFTPDFCGRVGFPSYSLTNLGANIRRLKERIKSIETQTARTEAATEAGGILITGDEYVKVTFDEKPERSIIDALKAAGFYWGSGSWHGKREALPAEIREEK